MATLEKINKKENSVEIPEIGNVRKVMYYIEKNKIDSLYFNRLK